MTEKKEIKKEIKAPLYTDEVLSSFSPYGFTLLFGNQGLSGPMTSLGMSPQHAKSMMLMLKKQIEEYEEKFGEISIDSKIQQDFEAVARKAGEKFQ